MGGVTVTDYMHPNPSNFPQSVNLSQGTIAAGAMQVPAANLGAPPPPRAVLVRFKRGREERFRVDGPLALDCALHRGPFGIWVKCSPGEDLGTVVRLFGPKSAGDTYKLKPAIRIATAQHMEGFRLKKIEEEKAIELGRRLTSEMNLPMRIDDAEFQFDKKRLTLFYHADLRVDFREFVKKMGSHFKTFLWMERSDGHSPPPQGNGIGGGSSDHNRYGAGR